MIRADGCKNGIYGPVMIAARLRVLDGVVTIEDADDLYQHTLRMMPSGTAFTIDTRPSGKSEVPMIRPLP